jgi:hypothetical protein
MPAKKQNPRKAPATKSSSRRSTSSYQCPNSGPRYTLKAIIEKMIEDEAFAKFIKKLLCKIHSGSKAEKQTAAECLDSYFAPVASELNKLCLAPSEQARIMGPCTDSTTTNAYLLDVPADVTVNYRKHFPTP